MFHHNVMKLNPFDFKSLLCHYGLLCLYMTDDLILTLEGKKIEGLESYNESTANM